MSGLRRVVLSAFLLSVLPLPVMALPSTVQIALDTDGVSTGGCTVSTADGPFAGVEQLLTVAIQTMNSTAVVEGVERQECVGGSLGAPSLVDPGSWPVGIGLGANGSHVVEARVPLADLGPGVLSVRFAILHLTDAEMDALVVTQPASSEPIVLLIRRALEIPTISQWGLLLLLMLLAWQALRRLGRNQATAVLLLISLVAVGGWAWAVCVLDGQIDDWSASDLLAVDTADDAALAVDLQAFFARTDGAELCLRVDTDLAFDQPPVAVDDTFEVEEGSVDNLLDVLANDTDPELQPLTVTQVGPPDQGGSAGTDGSIVAYTPEPTFVGVENFLYSIADGAGGTDDALVAVTVTPKCGNGTQDVLPQARATCSELLYGATVSGPTGPSELYAIDPETGVGTLIGTIGLVNRVSALDFDPDGQLFGIGVFNNEYFLFTVDCASPASIVLVGPLGLIPGGGRSVTDMSFDSLGRLWVHYRDTGTDDDELGLVSRSTGLYTRVGDTLLNDIGNGLTSGGFPSTTLYHAGAADLSTLDPTNGVASFVANLTFPPEAADRPRVNAMDVDFATGSVFVSLNDTPAGMGAIPQSYVADLNLGTGAVSVLTDPASNAPDSLDAIAFNRVYETCDGDTVLPIGASCGGNCRLVEEQCGDAVDNDFDGLVDCEDPDCNQRPCDDQDVCTTNEVCTMGQCLGQAVPNCVAGLDDALRDLGLPLVASQCADPLALLDLAGR